MASMNRYNLSFFSASSAYGVLYYHVQISKYPKRYPEPSMYSIRRIQRLFINTPSTITKTFKFPPSQKLIDTKN
jgi:hypothetical protein